MLQSQGDGLGGPMLPGRGADGYKERPEDKAEGRNGLGERYSHYQYTHGSLFFKGMCKRPHWLVAFGICDPLGLFKLVKRREGVRVGVCNTGMSWKADPVYEPRKDADM
jgi:2-polyprenyl-6-methoxyphenol hydroxylase-like FAD-dependent oxidoreductase